MKIFRSLLHLGSRAALPAVLLAAGPAFAVDNPFSAFTITTDGQFTGGVVNGQIVGEWSDITPLAFNSPASPGGQLFSVPVGSPQANSLLYGAISQGTSAEGPELYLMYDYAPRTSPSFTPGAPVANIAFPLTVGGQTFNNAQVEVTAGTIAQAGLGASGGFTTEVDLGNGTGLHPASQFGIESAVGFGPSTLTPNNHLLVELEVPLLIPAGFATPGGPLPVDGSSGVYSTDPATWSADIANNDVDPPSSSAIFQLNPDGTTTITPLAPIEPAPDAAPTAWLMVSALCGVAFLRRKLITPALAAAKL